MSEQIYPKAVRRVENAVIVTTDDGRELRFARGWADIWAAALCAAWDIPEEQMLDQGEFYGRWLKSGRSVDSLSVSEVTS